MVGSTTTTFPDALVVFIIFVVFVFVVVKFTQANARNIFYTIFIILNVPVFFSPFLSSFIAH